MKNIIKLFCVISFFITNVVYADIKFWTTEVQPARMAKQEEMAKAFEAKTGIKVEVIPIEEKEINFLLNTYTRDLGVLIEFIKKIDDHSMGSKRKITIPLIKELL